MPNSPGLDSPGAKFGGLLLGLSMAFCGMEMVPGWGVFHLDWPPIAFYGIMTVCCGLSGFLMDPEHRLAGLFGGIVGGPGALAAIALVLSHTTWTNDLIVVFAGAIGALPGVGLYKLLAGIEDKIFGPKVPDQLPGQSATFTADISKINRAG